MSARHTEMARLRWEKLPAYAYPQATIDRIKLLRKFHSQEDTATIVGVSKTYVSRIERRGFVPKKAGRPLPVRPGDFAIQCNHMTKHELADHYGVHLDTIEKWLVGVDRQYRSRRVYETKPIPSIETLEEAMRGRSMIEARDYLGVSGETFRKWRRYHGMPIAPRRKVGR
ncbi:hypothetical protein GG804_27085 [Sphingomonas histidinilytica]|uniref:helix-turn-helix domain-containing protein n=1 Tax=Rhizorhabdus histidinilytica TaxID=439228 RepID=UPI001ADC8E23|nr:helix-turn-helix transcriptional regulator [Rhizorhabdus histidinilytica]MBO9380433.1 hypothetical protein [Rhizorhabdus histidinilytica]